jgi:hypothetical protein
VSGGVYGGHMSRILLWPVTKKDFFFALVALRSDQQGGGLTSGRRAAAAAACERSFDDMVWRKIPGQKVDNIV